MADYTPQEFLYQIEANPDLFILACQQAKRAAADLHAEVKAQSISLSNEGNRVVQTYDALTARIKGLNSLSAMSSGIAEMQKADAAARALSTTVQGLGVSAAFSGRSISALIDESVAGRWRQLDGSIARVFGVIAANNGMLATQVALWGTLAAGVAAAAYAFIQVQDANEQLRGELLQTGNLTKDYGQSLIDSTSKSAQFWDTGFFATQKMKTELGGLTGTAAQYADQIREMAQAQASVLGGDVNKYLENIVKAFNDGGKGAENWASKQGILTEAQKEQIDVLSQGGHNMEAMQLVIDAFNKRMGDQARAVQEAKKQIELYNETVVGLGVGPVATVAKAPTASTLPKPNAGLNQQHEQELALVNKVNTALRERAIIDERIAEAQQALAHAGNATEKARAEEAITTLERQRQTVHTASEQIQHEATMARLQADLQANKDFTDRIVGIRQQMAAESRKYFGPNTSEVAEAEARVTDAIRANEDKQLQIKIQHLQDDQKAHAYDYTYQLKIEDQILEMLKKHYGEASTFYQQESKRRTEIAHEESLQQQALARESSQHQVEMARLLGEQAQIQYRSQFQSKKFPSLLDLMGGRDQTAEFQAQIDAIGQQYEKTMDEIHAAEEKAINPVEMQKLLNQEETETQKFANRVTQLHAQASLATQRAWTHTFEGIEQGMNRGLIGMVTGTTTGVQAMRSLITSFADFALGIPLKIAENWINQEVLKWLGINSADAAGQAAGQAARSAADVAAVTGNAAVAASGAYAATAAIPIIGPELAPAAAAEAQAATMAFAPEASAEVGMWNAPRDMTVAIHRGETIAPANFSQGLRAAASGDPNNATLGGGGTTYAPNVNVTIQATDAKSFMNQINAVMGPIAKGVSAAWSANMSMRPTY